MELKKEIIDLINRDNTIKILVTLDEENQPHTAEKKFVHISGDGKLVYLELLETSKSYKNFTHSLWYNQNVTFFILGYKSLGYQIRGKPERIIISGNIFEKYYKSVRKKLGDVDLAAVCIVEIEEVSDESFSQRFEEQEKKQPVFKHIDRLVK